MSDTTRWDKRAKALRYKWDKQSFHRTHWDKLDRKEKDYWRGRVQQYAQDQAEHVRQVSSSSEFVTNTSRGVVLYSASGAHSHSFFPSNSCILPCK